MGCAIKLKSGLATLQKLDKIKKTIKGKGWRSLAPVLHQNASTPQAAGQTAAAFIDKTLLLSPSAPHPKNRAPISMGPWTIPSLCRTKAISASQAGPSLSQMAHLRNVANMGLNGRSLPHRITRVYIFGTSTPLSRPPRYDLHCTEIPFLTMAAHLPSSLSISIPFFLLLLFHLEYSTLDQFKF
ncbi:hypothetical protein BC939DRAFT_447196 [Gamsiella multidivaricata]|uniref:uncharacterized protein n=1 Tax=Gamsiella multidivaricata TaxID=101098 RepID=UPI00221E4C2E|nr:uncharacterized protein BC939DRAFT_447196 [Gamsiella multidivaricata]KAI7826192.1 hypothetical protein BC939DRAFT_447196 [Gamsiella multidivaricata]